MSDINEMFKKVTASIEEASSKYSAQAEKALKEAQKSGELSAETKASVDLIASGKTQSNTIYYVKQKGFTNNAKTVAENTAKPYSTIE